jgi:hypothetical protein
MHQNPLYGTQNQPCNSKLGKEYKILVAKMVVDFSYVESTKTNLLNLCDIDTILSLPCILLVLNFINVLMKFA